MMFRKVILGGLALAVLALAGAAQTDEETVYKTPRAAFEAALAASKKGDVKGYMACLTPGSQRRMASGLALQSLGLRARAREDEDFHDRARPVLAVMSKHGITARATRDIRRPRDAEEAAKARRTLAELIKKPAAFAVEYLNALKKAGLVKKLPPPMPPGELRDVKIDGERATGSFILKIGDQQRIQTLRFARIEGSWKLIPPEARPPAR
jgi:hypothetical protein